MLANLKPGQYSVPQVGTPRFFHVDSGWLHAQAAQKCVQDFRHGLKDPFQPWLVLLSGLGASLATGRLQVQFPVRAHAWVAGQVPIWGCARGK